jgi:hypothetical protein
VKRDDLDDFLALVASQHSPMQQLSAGVKQALWIVFAARRRREYVRPLGLCSSLLIAEEGAEGAVS